MAHGKSLEMKQFDQEHKSEPKLLCKCGAVWDGPMHFTKKGELRKSLDRTLHYGLRSNGGRAMHRGTTMGFSRPSTAQIAKGSSRMAAIYGPPMPTRQQLRKMDKDRAARQVPGHKEMI